MVADVGLRCSGYFYDRALHCGIVKVRTVNRIDSRIDARLVLNIYKFEYTYYKLGAMRRIRPVDY